MGFSRTNHISILWKEILYIIEGMFNLGELEKYIRENGYDLGNIGFASIGMSGLIFIYLLIYRYVNKKILTKNHNLLND